ncbi:PAN domain [Popillia japonica]|uniref:PAN domain n=1 Tax=Popillia japonica TaxID=7064 RepID=A0AAW1K155_POPJA
MYEFAILGSSNQDDIGLPNPEGLQWQNQQFGIFVFKNDSSLNLGNDFCGKHDGFTVHPVNCHKFLFCKFGRLYLGQCKINMIYNHNLKTCDFSTKCPQSKSSLVGDLEISCDSKPDGLYRHPTACTKFIRCQNGAAHIHDCASGTLFNPVDKNCDFPHNVNCNVDNDNRNNENETEEERWQRYWDKQNPSGSRYKPTSWQDQWDQNQNSQWDQDQNQNSDWQSQNNQWSDQNNQWSDQDQNNQWGQDQNNYGWDQYFDQHNNWLPTEAPAVKVVDVSNVVSYDQNKKPTNQWPPPFPSTDPDADYVFELNDLVEPVVPEKRKDDAKVKNETCGEEDFHCTETICIEYKKVCDESADCPDGEDEKNCDEYIDEFSYVPSTQMAVKEEKRYENITLALCAKYCIESKGFVCKAFNFRKLDGICFLLATNVGLSGSLFVFPTYDYFEYEKYSINCPKELQCPNQKCIEEHQVCDGIKDCVDRYDEKDCTAEELGYSVRLVGSQKSYEGAVEVTALGKTGYVCDDNFYMASAHVLCKELGYHLGATEIKGNSYFTPDLRKNETFFIMDDVVCNGNEAGLKDCSFAGWGVSNCMEKEVLGIVCKTPEERCAAEMWQCESNDECIPMTFLCDNVEDCADYSDEDPAYCEAPLEMRLIGGQTPTEGRVEIRHHATWGTICDDDFNDDAARVVCKSLGFLGPARALKEAHFGPGSGPIWLDQVFCHGNETSLNDCIKWDWGVHNCDHSEDVSVVCNAYHNSESPRHSKASLPASSEPILVPDRCGYRNDDIFLDNPDVHFRVVQGSKAKQGQYPWQASLRVKGPTSLSHWCGAVVISAKFVLTAAHCLHGFTKGAYIVVAGDYDVNTEEGSEQQVYIDEFYIHEEFRKGTKMNNDIALIRLKGSGFNITRDVQPICLPDADFTDETGLNCTISGFGSVRSGRAVASKELRAGWIPIQPSDVCKMPHIYGNTITEGMICAGTLDGGVDACDGDSGGPLACLHNGLFTLVGMTSWGQHCGEANKPGVYVKIAHYRKWIDETMEKYDEID